MLDLHMTNKSQVWHARETCLNICQGHGITKGAARWRGLHKTATCGGRVTCLSADYALGHQDHLMIASGGFQEVRPHQGGGVEKSPDKLCWKCGRRGLRSQNFCGRTLWDLLTHNRRRTATFSALCYARDSEMARTAAIIILRLLIILLPMLGVLGAFGSNDGKENKVPQVTFVGMNWQ